MNILLKVVGLLASTSLVVSAASCADTSKGLPFRYQSDAEVQRLLEASTTISYPSAIFAVISDLHLFPSSLGSGPALDDYLASDRKMLKESAQILEGAIAAIRSSPAQFVLVPGDLSKDGERVSQEACASYLKQLETAGKQVYVVPGNHDILNPAAFSYGPGGAQRVPNVTPQEFAQIYADLGFNQALFRDTGSLSYVAEPVTGLWLLALDANRYMENPQVGEPVTDGKFSDGTLAWVEDMLLRARERGKAVIVMMHHNIMEHFVGEEKYFGEYVVDDYVDVSRLFTAYGVQMVFTGHYHAQDVTLKRFPGGKTIYDIETGSLVTYPSPIRTVTLSGNTARIATGTVKSIASHPTDFPQFARAYIEEGVEGIAIEAIEGFGVKHDSAVILAKQVGGAFAAHYAGDEKLPPGQPPISARGAGFKGWLVVVARAGMVTGLWHDLPPADNNITIDLAPGAWK
jgi:3',5'-cyclic AMP phosphodiesterase CpdA